MSIQLPNLTIGTPLIPYKDLGIIGGMDRPLVLLSDIPIIYSILGGLSEVGPKLASIAPNGAVRTAETGAGFTREEIHEGTVLNSTFVVTFAQLVSSLVINCDAQQATFAHSLDGVNYDAPKTLLAGEKFSADILTKAIKIVNTSATVSTGYRIWGLYFPATQFSSLSASS